MKLKKNNCIEEFYQFDLTKIDICFTSVLARGQFLRSLN